MSVHRSNPIQGRWQLECAQQGQAWSTSRVSSRGNHVVNCGDRLSCPTMAERRVFSAAIFRRGAKKELFDDKQEDEGWDEAGELQAKLRDLQELWAEPRTGSGFSAAIWRPDLGVAEVVLQKGKLFSHMGYTQGSKLFLHIEEAVYMVDRTNLLLFLGGGRASRGQQQLLSLQEAYDLMVGCGISMEHYLVYAKLMRGGYIVQRHPARWTLKISENPRQIWQRWYPEAGAGSACQQQQQQQQAGSQPAPPGGTATAPPVSAGSGGTAGRAMKRKLEQAAVQHGSWWQAGLGSLPWLQGLPAGFLDGLPRCEVAPESRSKWAEEYPVMAPLQALPDSELLGQGPGGDGSSMLDFDAYEPNSKFARKSAGAPNFRVVVRAPAGPCNHPFVGLRDMAAAERASPGIPVKFATVEDGDIAFYGLSHVQLRSIL